MGCVRERRRERAYSSLGMIQFHSSGESLLGQRAQLGDDELIELCGRVVRC